MKSTEISQKEAILLISWDSTALSAEVESKISSSSQDFNQGTWKSNGRPNLLVGGTVKNLTKNIRANIRQLI